MTAPDWTSSSVAGLSALSAAAAAGRNLRALAPLPEPMVQMSFAELGVLTRRLLIHRTVEDTPERAMAVADAITRARLWQGCVDLPARCRYLVISSWTTKTPRIVSSEGYVRAALLRARTRRRRSRSRVLARVSNMAHGSEQPRVVVVGGQFAGRRASRMLRRGGRIHVTLVDSKGFWEYTPGALRCLVEPKAARKMVQAQPRGTVRATAIGLESAGSDTTATAVKLNDGSSLPADHVVIATGSSYPNPIKAPHDVASSPEERRAQIEAAHATLVSAKSVVIVGGGTVGVELAAEIAGKWGRHKEVTLITPHDRLLERMPPRAGKLALRWLERKGVWVILNDRVEDWGGAPKDVATLRPGGGDWKLCTEQGRELRASLVYPCIGGRSLPGPLGTRGVGKNGDVRVDLANGLRVEGFDNVYAAGDCCGTNEEKNAFTADLNATAVARRILASYSRKPVALNYPRSVCGQDATPNIAVVSLHKRNAVMQFNSLVLGGPLPAFVKGMIEFFQVHSALGTPGMTFVWDALESTNVFFGRFLF